MWYAIMFLTFCSAFLLAQLCLPGAVNKAVEVNDRRAKELALQMERMYLKDKAKMVFLIYAFGPILLGGAGYLFFPEELRLLGVVLGVVIGFVVPGTYIKYLEGKRKSKFQDQLVDTLMILSSSLKGGLSLIQAMEVAVEEMPVPMSEEVGVILGENKMGVSLEDSLSHLYQRMPSTALNQLITAILLARETGGNLPIIFQRIVNTIRENKKIQQNIDNLTLQGKIQGVVMSLLPIGFAMIVTSTNPKFFNQMLNSDIGKTLLVYAAISEVIGAFLIWKISSFKEF